MTVCSLKDTSKAGFKEYVDDVYYKLFMFLSDGIPPDEHNNRNMNQHPVRHKWERTQRYTSLNLMNMIFSERKTVEHRSHSATLNSQKVINWLYIVVAICKYAEKNVQKIFTTEGNISLKEVLNYYKDNFPANDRAAFLSDYLYAYYESRVKAFAKDIKNEDKLSEWDLKKDRTYKFEYQGISSLV